MEASAAHRKAELLLGTGDGRHITLGTWNAAVLRGVDHVFSGARPRWGLGCVAKGAFGTATLSGARFLSTVPYRWVLATVVANVVIFLAVRLLGGPC